MTVRISSKLHQQLVSAALASPDVEVCGLLLGRDKIEQVVATRNVAADRRRAFEIDPQALFAAIRTERHGGSRLLGYYHSHPTGSLTPSAHDEAQASVDGRVWLIIGNARIAAWRMTSEGGFAPVAYEVADF